MLDNKVFQICLAIILLTASLTLSFSTVDASSAEYHLIITTTEGGEVIQPEDDVTKHEEGEEPVIEAKADENYEFKSWSGDIESIGNSSSNLTQIEMQDNYTIKAEFEKEARDLTIDVEGGGEVIKPGEGEFEYEHGETVVIEAEADDHHAFVEWTGDTENIDDTESKLTTIEMEDDYEITAEFEEDYYELSIDSDGNGEVIRPGEGNFEIEREKEIVLEAEPDENNEFLAWTGDIENIDDPNSELTTIVMEDDYDITAEFQKEWYNLTIDIDGEGEVLRPGEGEFEYEYNEKIILEVEAAENYTFDQWTGDIENIDKPESELAEIIIKDDYEITAEFKEDYHELSIDVDGEGRVIQPGEGSFGYDLDEKVVIEAEADGNYEFIRWTGDIENVESPESRMTRIIMEDDYDITAEFEKKQYELNIEVNDEDKGQIIRPEELNSIHEFEDEVILEVEAEDGYKFTGWSGDTGSIDDTDSTLAVIEITDDHDITAEFESEEFELKNEWIVIAVLLVIIAFLIIQRFAPPTEESEESEPKEGVCENCGEIIPADSRECPECGTPLIPKHLPEMRKASESE